MMKKPLRVAFTSIPRGLWSGGYNYQSNLFRALQRYHPGTVTPVLFAGPDENPDDLAALAAIPGVEFVQSPAFRQSKKSLMEALVLGRDSEALAEFSSARIDLIFESARYFGWRLPVPAMAWFPDFQHRRLPQLFPVAARWRRELGFRAQIASRRHVLLSSESARRDFLVLYPRSSNRISVVKFSSQPDPVMLTADISAIRTLYGLQNGFFYLPNQFWRHKNHGVVLEALALLKTRSRNIVVAASGSATDYREPSYFAQFMKRVDQLDLRANFRYLGMIPLDHVYGLMRSCMALINPSRFEGWSTTVEEARAFGVPMILSDIDVHREQSAGEARYFDVRDSEALASHLDAVAAVSSPMPQRTLQPDAERRVEAFAANFIGAAQQAAELLTT